MRMIRKIKAAVNYANTPKSEKTITRKCEKYTTVSCDNYRAYMLDRGGETSFPLAPSI